MCAASGEEAGLWGRNDEADNKEDGMKHTPGPWKALKGHDGDSERWVVVADRKLNYRIAVIENGQPGDTLETEGFTAHLIAEAPAILEAAKYLAHMVGTENVPGNYLAAIMRAERSA